MPDEKSTTPPPGQPGREGMKQPGIIFSGLKSKLTSQELLAHLGGEPEPKKETKDDKPFDVGGLQAAKE